VHRRAEDPQPARTRQDDADPGAQRERARRGRAARRGRGGAARPGHDRTADDGQDLRGRVGHRHGRRRRPMRGVPLPRERQRVDDGRIREPVRRLADGPQPGDRARAALDGRVVGHRGARARGVRGRAVPRAHGAPRGRGRVRAGVGARGAHRGRGAMSGRGDAGIRSYRSEDLARLREICVLTGAAGGDATGRWSTDDLLPDLFLEPYVTASPEWAWVVDEGDGPVGYLGAGPRPRRLVQWWHATWTPAFAARYPAPDEPYSDEESLVRRGYDPEVLLVPEV